MARLYADEDFPYQVVIELRSLGHEVLTTPEAQRAGLRIPDDDQLIFARSQGRTLLTLNRRHFIKLHERIPDHAGIITCTVDADTQALARRIDKALRGADAMQGMLIRIVRPSSTPPRS